GAGGDPGPAAGIGTGLPAGPARFGLYHRRSGRRGAGLQGKTFPTVAQRVNADHLHAQRSLPFRSDHSTIRRIKCLGPPPQSGSQAPRNSAMKPSPYTVRYSPQEVDHYYRTGLWSTDTFHDLLVRQVDENPDKVFATDGTRSLTFRELFDAG